MKKLRYIPAAITPVYANDLIAAIVERGDGVGDFEGILSKYFSQSNAYTFGSLMRTVYACFVGLGKQSSRNKVVLPRYTCPSFIHGVIAAGFAIEYCDVDSATLSIDLESLSKINLEDVLAVVCTNLFGLTSKIDKICELCNPVGVYVVEGVDYGVGTEYNGKRIGTWGDVAILNFQEGKAIPVGGGAIVSSLDIFKKLYGHSRKRAFPNYVTMAGFVIFSKPVMYALFIMLSRLLRIDRKRLSMEDTIRNTKSETDFVFDSCDYSQSISRFQGHLAIRIFSRLEQDICARLKNAERLHSIFKNIDIVKVVEPHSYINKIHYIRYPILVAKGQRDILLSKLLSVGIEASPMYVEHGMDIDKSEYPGAARVASELLTLPCHPYMTEYDFGLIENALLNYKR